MNAKSARSALRKVASVEKAKVLSRFFKTGKGEYGEGDIFLGVTVPKIRAIAREHGSLAENEIRELIRSEVHEERMLALVIVVNACRKEKDTRKIAPWYRFYFSNMEYINNWDLIDTSAEHVVGKYLSERDRTVLKKLARSRNLWERRVGILSTFYFLRRNDFKDTIEIAEILLNDEHDLIHKAVGWLLREVGKRHLATLESFLIRHYRNMPRTMLRYAIEKLPERRRLQYLHGRL